MSTGAARRGGWLPVQHGAWAFLTVPYVVGMVPAGPRWIHLPLGLFWVCGYLTYQAGASWLKSRRKPRYRPAIATYGALSAVFGVATAIMEPQLVRWAAAFVPLAAVAVYTAIKRQERSLISGLATAAAACLMTPVAAAAGAHPDIPAALWAAAVLFGYFGGTVFYVKTMIRERGQQGWLTASIAFHASISVALIFANWLLGAFFALMTLRAAIAPRYRLAAKTIGFGEIAASALLAAIFLTGHGMWTGP